MHILKSKSIKDGGYHMPYRRPFMFFPYGFGLPFAGGLIGGLALGSLIRPRPYYGYPYYAYPPYYWY